jgi:uncharacterized protein (UPF0332 family)
MTGDEFIVLAGKLAADPRSGAASYRTAVSRAYYGAYHLAKALLKNELDYDPGAPHGETWTWLARTGDQRAEEASSVLSSLYSNRRRADYELDDPKNETPAFAKFCVEMAADIESTIKACRVDKARMATMKARIAKRAGKT